MLCFEIKILVTKIQQKTKHCQRHNGLRSPDGATCIACKCGQNLVFLAPPGGATCIGYKFSHQMALLALLVNVAKSWCFLHDQMAPHALITNLATRWPHLHWFQFWPQGGATFISYKFGHLHCHIAYDCPIDINSCYWVINIISQSHICSVCKTSCTHSDRAIDTYRSDLGYLGPIKTIYTRVFIRRVYWKLRSEPP